MARRQVPRRATSCGHFPTAGGYNPTLTILANAYRVADYFGTQGTPYFYVIDKQGLLRYEGICDNNQVPKRFELDPETVTSHFVRDAIEAVLAGNPVQKKSVPTGAT